MKVRIYQKDKNYGGMPKDLSLADLCFCQKILIDFYQIYGLHIMTEPRLLHLGFGGKKYLDMSNMGVGTNVLGYIKIDNKVTSNIKKVI